MSEVERQENKTKTQEEMRLLDSPASRCFRKVTELGGVHSEGYVTKLLLGLLRAADTQVSVVSLDVVGEKSGLGEWGEGVNKDNSSKQYWQGVSLK